MDLCFDEWLSEGGVEAWFYSIIIIKNLIKKIWKKM